MAAGRKTEQAGGTGSRLMELVGDSPELVALGLVRQLVQLEQQDPNGAEISRGWLLDAYAECLTTVKGERVTKPVLATEEGRLRKKVG